MALPYVYCLIGDDSVGRRKLCDDFLRKIKKAHPTLEEEKFDSSQEPFDSYVERALSPSLFQTSRFFHVRHGEELTDNNLKSLRSIIQMVIPDVFFVLEYDSNSKKNKSGVKGFREKSGLNSLLKKDPQNYVVVESTRPPDYKMADWLVSQTPLLFKRSIEKEGAELLVDLVGYELEQLYSELQKIDINLEGDEPITVTMIEEVTGVSRDMSPFELAEALGKKNFERVAQIIDSLFRDNFYGPATVGVIFRHFWNVFKVRLYAENNRSHANMYFKTRYKEQTKVAFDIGVGAGMLKSSDNVNRAYPVMVLSGIIDQAVKFKFHHLRQIFYWLREYDIGLKTGKVKDDKGTFQELCLKIVEVAHLTKDEVA